MILDAVTAIATLVESCLGDECDYKVVIGQGASPIEGCNLITVYPSSSVLSSPGKRCYRTNEERVTVSVTRCCPAIDGGLDWDSSQEEVEAVCMMNTIAQLEDCFECDLADALTGIAFCAVDEAYLESAVFAPMREGGCYVVDLSVRFLRQRCCPPPPE